MEILESEAQDARRYAEKTQSKPSNKSLVPTAYTVFKKIFCLHLHTLKLVTA